MKLVINTRGSYLKKGNNRFIVKNDDKTFEVSASKIESILITTSATITTDAIEFAIDNNIEIVFLNCYGDPYGRVWHPKLGSTTLIRRKQLEASNSSVGFIFVRNWVVEKMDNQIKYLKDLKKNRSSNTNLDEYISKIDSLKNELSLLSGTLNSKRNSIMGIEGIASRYYFEALSNIMPDKWKFNGRSRDPAIDGFNCLLNYGYGILYSQVEKACIISGLDPYVGFLHTDNYNKKSFVFDFIEVFRNYIDRAVVNLFSKKKVHDKMFDKIPNGLYLNKEGKSVLITSVNEMFDKEVKYNKRNVKIKNLIMLRSHNVANKLINWK